MIFAMKTAARALVASACFLGGAGVATANDFYKGKTITLVISAGPGGGYATYVLTVAKYMQNHIPGNPDFIRQHRQGAGGLVAANYMYHVAKRDGTVIATAHRGAVTTSALFGESGANYDPAKFSWIGSVDKDVNLCVAWHEAPVKTFADARRETLIVGGIGPGSSTDTYPIVYNNLFGTKFKLVTGYNQGTAVTLAMERGEVHGRCGWSWSSLNATRGDWLRDGKVNILVVGGMSRTPGIPESVPMAHDFATTREQRDILDLLLAPLELARPVFGPPEMPADLVHVLRTAFDATMKDPAFVAEAKERGLDVDPLSGHEVEALIANIFSKPKHVVEAAKEATTRMDRVEVIKRR